MQASKTRAWVMGAVVVALLLAIGSYMLLISPVLASASEASASAVSTEQSNDQLQAKVTHLAQQFAHLDDYKAQLAGLQAQIPTEAQLSAYLVTVDTLAAANSVTVTTLTPSEPATFTPAAPVAAPAPAAADTTSTDASAATADPASSAPAAPASGAPAGMADIALNLDVVGSYDHVVAFLNALQTTPGRYLLITGLTGTGLTDAQANGGRPATSVGDLEATVTSYLYVLPDPTAVAPPVDPAAPAVPLPAAVPGKNPLIPVS